MRKFSVLLILASAFALSATPSVAAPPGAAVMVPWGAQSHTDRDNARRLAAAKLGLPENASWGDIDAGTRKAYARSLGLDENATLQEIVEVEVKAYARSLGLDENATLDEIMETERKAKARALGLDENATEEEIHRIERKMWRPTN